MTRAAALHRLAAGDGVPTINISGIVIIIIVTTIIITTTTTTTIGIIIKQGYRDSRHWPRR